MEWWGLLLWLGSIVGAFWVGVIFEARVLWQRDLQPGKCECSHPRCAHTAGRGVCHVTSGMYQCACQTYVPICGEDLVAQNELKRLRKMAGLDK
jgi:hypothetical protein